MKAPIEIKDGKTTYTGSVPTSWDDITLEEFYRFTAWGQQADKDWIEFYQLMTGIPYEVLERVREGSAIENLDSLLGFLWANPGDAKLHERPIPTEIEIEFEDGKKTIPIPRKIEQKQLGQKFAITLHFQELKQEHKDPVIYQLHRAAGIIAILLYQEITGSEKFELDLALAYKKRIMALPATQAIPLAVFFWNGFTTWSNAGSNNSKPSPQPSKSRQG